MTSEAAMMTTMRETDPKCDGETEAILTIARLLREEVDPRVDLDEDFRNAGLFR